MHKKSLSYIFVPKSDLDKMRLSELKTGEKGVIIKVMGHGGFRRRIIEMGFIKGKTVEVLLNAPLKDPVKYKIMGYEISLRRNEAAMIEVVSEEEARNNSQGETTYLDPIAVDTPVSEEKMKEIAQGKRRTINVALVGNPNCGKTSLFNVASGGHEHVGNYSGVTVDAKVGTFSYQGYQFNLVDLPGTYSLSAYSPEELYVRKHIIDKTPDVIINVVDAGNLERNLYLTTQLIDMNVRMVIALNMFDALEKSGNTLDYHKLGNLLGVPIVPTVSRSGEGIENLFHVIIALYEGIDFMGQKKNIQNEAIREYKEWHDKYVPDHKFGSHDEEVNKFDGKNYIRHIHINHGPVIEKSIDAVKSLICKNENIRYKYSTRFLAIKLLENDKDIENMVAQLPNGKEIISTRNKEAEKIKLDTGEDSEQSITDAKYAFISGALKETFVEKNDDPEVFTRIVDSIVTHRIWGYPIFFLFLYIMFECTFILGAYPQDWIEWTVAQIGNLVQTYMPNGALKDLVVDGIIGGVGGVIVFLPNILLLYIFISLMEDSGYMARAAFIMDKIMHKMGLHGKSFIPLIMGFGCNVPAIMASRIIESRKSRLVTMLINPLMSCSARLPIYLVLIGAFFPGKESLILLSIYAVGILLAILMARILSKFIVKGDDAPFVMELPPYRMPTPKSVLRHTWEKGAQYLKKMGGVIMVASIIIWFLGYYPNHDAYNTVAEQQENSYIGQLGQAIEPVIEPLGFDWKMGIGLLSGVGAKELVVSTLGVLYANDEDADSASLAGRIPITPLVAYAYMLFILIYFPCLATLTAIKNESGSWKWAAFAAVYTTMLAWVVAFLVFRIGSLFI